MSGLGYNTTYLDIEAAKEKQKLDQDEKGYQLVSNVSPDGILTYGSEEEIGVLDAWKQNRLYIGPRGPGATSTSSSFGSWFRNKFSGGPYPSPPITTSPPRCSNCEGRGCMYCQKGGKTRRRRLSTRRRRGIS